MSGLVAPTDPEIGHGQTRTFVADSGRRMEADLPKDR